MSARSAWAAGSARYFIERETDRGTLIHAVNCRLGLAGEVQLARLDTGAQWSIIGGELAARAFADADPTGQSLRLSTRHGRLEISLVHLEVTLVADSGHGDDLVVRGTVGLAPDWLGPPVVLGTICLLERVRIELEQGTRLDDCWWSFGRARE